MTDNPRPMSQTAELSGFWIISCPSCGRQYVSDKRLAILRCADCGGVPAELHPVVIGFIEDERST